jgi:hypothetical protein
MEAVLLAGIRDCTWEGCRCASYGRLLFGSLRVSLYL